MRPFRSIRRAMVEWSTCTAAHSSLWLRPSSLQSSSSTANCPGGDLVMPDAFALGTVEVSVTRLS